MTHRSVVVQNVRAKFKAARTTIFFKNEVGAGPGSIFPYCKFTFQNFLLMLFSMFLNIKSRVVQPAPSSQKKMLNFFFFYIIIQERLTWVTNSIQAWWWINTFLLILNRLLTACRFEWRLWKVWSLLLLWWMATVGLTAVMINFIGDPGSCQNISKRPGVWVFHTLKQHEESKAVEGSRGHQIYRSIPVQTKVN